MDSTVRFRLAKLAIRFVIYAILKYILNAAENVTINVVPVVCIKFPTDFNLYHEKTGPLNYQPKPGANRHFIKLKRECPDKLCFIFR